MSSHNAAGSDGVLSNSPSDANGTHNPLGDVTNVLGFLLAGFGAVLSFLGLRSSEVTTVLRNDSLQASLIAFLLLLGILAAVSAVATDSKREVSWHSAVAIGVTLLGVGALVIFATPISANFFSLSGTIILAIGCVFFLAGIAKVLHYVFSHNFFYAEHGAGGTGGASLGSGAGPGGAGSGGNPTDGGGPASSVHWKVPVILVLASVMLIAIAAYGAMRLETKSQLSFASQVGATFSINGSLATASVNIAATKIAQSDWVFVDVYAVPITINLASACESVTAPKGAASCTTDPCLYFTQKKYVGPGECASLLNGTVVPSATGDVNEKLSVPFPAAKYQDVDVRAEVCSQEACEGNPTGQNSRLDWAFRPVYSKVLHS